MFLNTIAIAAVAVSVYARDPNSYTPVKAACGADAKENIFLPGGEAQITDAESAWVKAREEVLVTAWKDYFDNVQLEGFETFEYNSSSIPRVALGASGGGHRAALSAFSVLNAFDMRDAQSKTDKTGGVYQILTYIAGISGGSWTLGAIVANDNAPINDVATKYIDISNNLPIPGDTLPEQTENMANITEQVVNKQAAGYQVSLVDFWAKDVSFQFLHNIENFGDDLRLSDIAKGDNSFTNHTMPFPIIVATVFENGTATGFDLGEGADSWEWNPYTTGSYAPSVNAFIKTEAIGTQYMNGTSVVDDVCVTNYDNLGYVMGTSSGYFTSYNGIGIAALVRSELSVTNQTFPDQEKILTTYESELPSFIDGLSGTDVEYMGDSIRLSDGGYAEGNVPVFSLAHPARDVDIIITLDNAGDNAQIVPNGDSVVRFANYSRMQEIPFPDTPTKEEYAADPSLAAGIRFFGCYDPEVPTLVYIANQPVAYNTNQTVMKLSYQDDEIAGFMKNGHAILTQQAGFEDAPVCIACLFASEAGFQSDQCDTCMVDYCWMREPEQ